MADDKEVRIEQGTMDAADELAELDGGKTTPGPIDTPETAAAASVESLPDEKLDEANAEVPLPIAMSPAEVDARADAVEAVEEQLEEEGASAAPRRVSSDPGDIQPEV